MTRSLICALAASASLLAGGCSSLSSSDSDAYDQLTSERLDSLDAKLVRWSSARNSGDPVGEEMLRRDLRREAGKFVEALRLGIASPDSGTRAICAAAIGFTEDARSLGMLLPLIRDPDPAVRANVLLALCLIRSRRTPVDEVANALMDPEAPVRRLAVLCLAELHDPAGGRDVFLRFVEALKDPDEAVRMNASASLEKIADLRAAPFLAETCLADANAKVRLNGAVGLARLKARGHERALVSALRREMNPSVRRELASALRACTGADHGEDADAWERGLETVPPAQPAEPAQAGGAAGQAQGKTPKG